MLSKKRVTRRAVTVGLLAGVGAAHVPGKWVTPVINSLVLPAHGQTSAFPNLCADGTSTWLMSDYEENGTSFNQGTPQSQVEITISGTQINLITDWCVINSVSNSQSRGRVTDSGTVNLITGAATTSPTGSPTVSPTHGGVVNLANNLAQTFILDCADSDSFVVQGASNIYSFRLTRTN